MTEKWRKALNVGDHEGAHQTDISKVFKWLILIYY